MKLYYAKGACSLAPHIILNELNMVYELEAVDLMNKTTASGDYRKINPKGTVPALRMDNGQILTEGPVIDQYLADMKPEANLFPKYGTLERVRCQEWLNYTTSEIHKSFSAIFGARRTHKDEATQNEFKSAMRELLSTKIGFISEKLGGNDYLMGKQFSIADAYMFTCLNWSNHVGIDLAKWPNVASYMERVRERPSVQKAMKEEGSIK